MGPRTAKKRLEIAGVAPRVTPTVGSDSREMVLAAGAHELVFAVVGHVGAGTSTVATQLLELLSSKDYDVKLVKAREIIERTADVEALARFQIKSVERIEYLQNLGDGLRERDHAAIARRMIQEIREVRAQKTGVTPEGAVIPDGAKRAYILESIRHPAEVELLRRVYGPAFNLLGVVCEPEIRTARLSKKFDDVGHGNANKLMARDEKDAGIKHGQRVRDAFHMSDYFVDNTSERLLSDGVANPAWIIPEQLNRFVKLVLHTEMVRPTPGEAAMYAAFGAQVQSACLSRQVGACLVDARGTIIATGTNEVPRAGGGHYLGGESEEPASIEEGDARCAFRRNPGRRHCSNTKEQQRIVSELVDEIGTACELAESAMSAVRKALAGSRISQILEFSRAVHAEMDALLAAGRGGMSTVGTKLYVTTYPCHYCARHIVAAGVEEVHYIEPYPKSLATTLHDDSIAGATYLQTSGRELRDPSGRVRKVIFRPFTGVAPRLYSRAFLKDRDLKDDATGKMLIGEPTWGSAWFLGKLSYVELEALLSGEGSDG